MDESAKIAARTQFLRLKFRAASAAPDKVGCLRYVTDLGNNSGAQSVVINSMSFEGEQSTGVLVMEPLIELQAAMIVLREIDPDNTPMPPARVRLAHFGCMPTET